MTTEQATIECLRARVKEPEGELLAAHREVEQASEARESAEEKAAEQHLNADYIAAKLDRHVGVATSLHNYVWLNDDKRPVHCRACGRGWPIHRHDCPLVAVE